MNRHYPNLEAEMARYGIKRKEFADALDVRAATIYDKMNGKYPFTLDEATLIKKKFFPNLTIDYLFSKDVAVVA